MEVLVHFVLTKVEQYLPLFKTVIQSRLRCDKHIQSVKVNNLAKLNPNFICDSFVKFRICQYCGRSEVYCSEVLLLAFAAARREIFNIFPFTLYDTD